MTIRILKFETEAEWLECRKGDITATAVSAVMGLNKFKSRFTLWHEKKSGQAIDEFVETDRTKWGKRLEKVIAQGICEDNGWEASHLGLYYIQDPELRYGASLDVLVKCPDRGEGLMEVKNVGIDAFGASWTDEEAPVYYECQLQWEMHLANLAGVDIKWGVIAALVGGNDPKLYFRDYDPEIGRSMERQIADFWRSVDEGIEPKPDYALDGPTLAKLRGAPMEGKEIDLSTNNRVYELIVNYQNGSELEKAGKEAKDLAKTELLDLMGSASKGKVGNTTITAGMVAGTQISYFREPYRNFRITTKKG